MYVSHKQAYYASVALLVLVVAQVTKFISFKQALGIPLDSGDYLICFIVGIFVGGMTTLIRLVVEKELLVELKRRREEKENENP